MHDTYMTHAWHSTEFSILKRTQACSKCFIQINSCNLHAHSVTWTLSFLHVSGEGNQGTERLNNQPSVTQTVSRMWFLICSHVDFLNSSVFLKSSTCKCPHPVATWWQSGSREWKGRRLWLISRNLSCRTNERGWAWRWTPVIRVFRRLKQKDSCQFQAREDYIARRFHKPCV